MCLWNCYLYTHSFDADPTVENYSRSFFGPKTGGGFKVKTPRTRNKSSKRTKTHTEEDMNKGKDLVGNLDSLAEDDKARLEFMMEQRQIHDRFLFLFCITFGLFLGWCFFFNIFLIFLVFHCLMAAAWDCTTHWFRDASGTASTPSGRSLWARKKLRVFIAAPRSSWGILWELDWDLQSSTRMLLEKTSNCNP